MNERRELKEPKRKQKYYAELIDDYSNNEYDNNFLLQSKWFDTEQAVFDWVKTIDYIDDNFKWLMMSAYFDEQDNFDDIFYMYDIAKEHEQC